MSVLFPSLMADNLIKMRYELSPKTTLMRLMSEFQRLNLSDSVFKYEIRKYLGLGFLFSFIPGTKAFQARLALNKNSNVIVAELREILEDMRPYQISASHKRALSATLRGPILEWLTFGPFSEIMHIVTQTQVDHVVMNRKPSMKKIFFSLPIINGMKYYPDINSFGSFMDAIRYFTVELTHRVLNPVLLLVDTLNFLQNICYRIADIGGEKNQASGPTRTTVKLVIAGLFSTAQILVRSIAKITDIVYQLDLAIGSTILFFTSALKQAFSPAQNHTIIKKETVAKFNSVQNRIRAEEENVPLKKNTFKQGSVKNPIAARVVGKNGIPVLADLILDFSFAKDQKLDQCNTLPPRISLGGKESLTTDLSLFRNVTDKAQQIAAVVEQDLPERETMRKVSSVLHS